MPVALLRFASFPFPLSIFIIHRIFKENTKEIWPSHITYIYDINGPFSQFQSWGLDCRDPNGTFDTHIAICYFLTYMSYVTAIIWHICHLCHIRHMINDIWQKYHMSIWVSKVPLGPLQSNPQLQNCQSGPFNMLTIKNMRRRCIIPTERLLSL